MYSSSKEYFQEEDDFNIDNEVVFFVNSEVKMQEKLEEKEEELLKNEENKDKIFNFVE